MDRNTGEIKKFNDVAGLLSEIKQNSDLVPISEDEAKEAETKTLEERVAWLEKRLADMEAERRVNDLGIVTKGVEQEMKKIDGRDP